MKLVKKAEGWYNLYDGEVGIGSTHEELQQPYKLSIANCDEIFGIFDVEKLADEFVNDLQVASETVNRAVKLGYEEGFIKRAELNKEKVFTSDDMLEMMLQTINWMTNVSDWDGVKMFEQTIQRLQQPTEIEVEIIKESIGRVKLGVGSSLDQMMPQLDETGCIILKKTIKQINEVF